MKLPRGMSLSTTDDELIITHRWFQWVHLILLGIVSFMVTFALFFSELHTLEFLLNPLSWMVIGLGFYSLIRVVNRTVVRINARQLTIRHGPLSLRRNRLIEAAEVDQVYVTKEVRRGSKSTTTTYDVYVTDRQTAPQKIIPDLETPEQALFFEQEIERYLGIKDRVMPGEYQSSEPYDFRGWANFAGRNGLAYSPGKLPTGHHVSGDYQGYEVALVAVDPPLPLAALRTRLTLTTPEPLVETVENKELAPPLTPDQVADLFAVPLIKPGLSLKGTFKVAEGQGQLIYEQEGVETDEALLQAVFDTLYRLRQREAELVALGGEALAVLQPIALDQNHPAQAVAIHLIREIAPTTEYLHQADQAALLCPRCLVRCATHEVKASWFNTITYFGCRHCHQSREFLNIDRVMAVLDHRAGATAVQAGQTLTVNWLSRQTMFDFDTVAIIEATDEEVERFAVQIGNDTDPIRQVRYPAMACFISPDCQLSANTRRILQRTFGQVEVKEPAWLNQTTERPSAEPSDIEESSAGQTSAE